MHCSEARSSVPTHIALFLDMIWRSPRDGCPVSEAQGSRAILKGVNKGFCVLRPILMKFSTGKAVLRV